MATFAGCEQEARDIFADRLAETDFRERLADSGRVWEIGFPALARRCTAIIAIGLVSAYRDGPGRTNAEAAAAALTCLRELSPMELFAVLPADLGGSSALVEHLRLLSIGLTGRSALMWERLVQTARNVLDAEAQYPDEDHVVGGTEESGRDSGDRAEGTLTTGPAGSQAGSPDGSGGAAG